MTTAQSYWETHKKYRALELTDREVSKTVKRSKDYMPDIYFGFYTKPLFKNYFYDRAIYEQPIRSIDLQPNSFITLLTDQKVFDQVDILRDYVEGQIFDAADNPYAKYYNDKYITTDRQTGERINRYVAKDAAKFSIDESGAINQMYIEYYVRRNSFTQAFFSSYLGLLELFFRHVRQLKNEGNYIIDTDSRNISKYMATVLKFADRLESFQYRGYASNPKTVTEKLAALFDTMTPWYDSDNKVPVFYESLFIQHYKEKPKFYSKLTGLVTLSFLCANETLIKSYGELNNENANKYTTETLDALIELSAPGALIFAEIAEIPSISFYAINIVSHIRRKYDKILRYNGAIIYGDVIAKTHHCDGMFIVFQKL